MSAPAESLSWSPPPVAQLSASPVPDRRADIDDKQAWIAELLHEVNCEGLLVLEPENFTWLTSGGFPRGVLNPEELPALYFNAEQRCVLASNVDSQRIFDQEIDGLGFQLKEWPWHWGRQQLIADLCQGKRVASDAPGDGWQPVGEALRQRRRELSAYEQACFRSLGQVVTHALEATCRNLVPGQSEREAAGQLGHRLLHRGAYPVTIGVAGDGRSRLYRRGGFTSAAIERSCLLTATARKYGLHVTAARAMCFGPLDDEARRENEATCKIAATYVGATWADAVPRAILHTGRHVYQLSAYEHEWRQSPQGFVTGRAAVELPLLPGTEDLLQVGWAVTWRASAGAAVNCDTYLITPQGPEVITPAEAWPLKRVRFHGADILQPFPLEK